MSTQLAKPPRSGRYGIAAGASIVFPLVYVIEPPAGLFYDLIALLEFALVILAVLVMGFSLDRLFVERFDRRISIPVALFTWGLVAHLLTLRAIWVIFNRLALVETDFARASLLEVVLGLICLLGAYLSGIGAILIGDQLARVNAHGLGWRRGLFYAFVVAGMLMTAYSIVVTLQNFVVNSLILGLIFVTFQLTDLAFIVLCVLLALFFARMAWQATR